MQNCLCKFFLSFRIKNAATTAYCQLISYSNDRFKLFVHLLMYVFFACFFTELYANKNSQTFCNTSLQFFIFFYTIVNCTFMFLPYFLKIELKYVQSVATDTGYFPYIIDKAINNQINCHTNPKPYYLRNIWKKTTFIQYDCSLDFKSLSLTL